MKKIKSKNAQFVYDNLETLNMVYWAINRHDEKVNNEIDDDHYIRSTDYNMKDNK